MRTAHTQRPNTTFQVKCTFSCKTETVKAKQEKPRQRAPVLTSLMYVKAASEITDGSSMASGVKTVKERADGVSCEERRA